MKSLNLLPLFLLTACSSFSQAASPAETWSVVSRSIHDGDTLRVTNGQKVLKIRFCAIDAPELDQPLGKQSRDYLRSLLSQSPQVKVTRIELDRYGRTVAELSRFTGQRWQNLNVEMVKAGQAYYYARYAADCPSNRAIAQAENEARSQRLGVWGQNNPIRPWDWRKLNRGG